MASMLSTDHRNSSAPPSANGAMADEHAAPPRRIRVVSDEAWTTALKRVVRDHRGLIHDLAK